MIAITLQISYMADRHSPTANWEAVYPVAFVPRVGEGILIGRGVDAFRVTSVTHKMDDRAAVMVQCMVPKGAGSELRHSKYCDQLREILFNHGFTKMINPHD